MEWKTSLRTSFHSLQALSTLTYPLRGDGRQARQQQKSKEIDNAGPGKSHTDLKQFMKNGRLGANQSSRAIFLELTGSSTGWWGIPPHSLQSRGQRFDGACRSSSDASCSLGKWLKQAQQRQDDGSWQPQSPMAAQRMMTMPGFCFVFPIFFCYEGTVGRRRHMTGMVISTGWISKTISLRTDKLKELRAFHHKKIFCFAEYLTRYF